MLNPVREPSKKIKKEFNLFDAFLSIESTSFTKSRISSYFQYSLFLLIWQCHIDIRSKRAWYGSEDARFATPNHRFLFLSPWSALLGALPLVHESGSSRTTPSSRLKPTNPLVVPFRVWRFAPPLLDNGFSRWRGGVWIFPLSCTSILSMFYWRVAGVQDLSWTAQTKVWTPEPSTRQNKVDRVLVPSQMANIIQSNSHPMRMPTY